MNQEGTTTMDHAELDFVMAYNETYYHQPSRPSYYIGVTTMDNEELDFVKVHNETYYHQPSSYYIASLTLFFLVGTFGNLSLIWLFVRDARLQDVSYALISNLAFSDFLCMLIFVPALIYSDFHRYRPFGKYFCYLFTSLTYTSHDVSILSFVALSVVRYQVVVHPLSTLVRHAKYKTSVVCLFSWIIGIGFSILPASHCQEELNSNRPIKQHYVSMDNEDWQLYLPVRFFLLYVVPLFVITVLHCQMAKKLLLDSSILKRNASISAQKALSSRKRLGIILILLIISFALCWLPNYIVLYMVCFTTASIPQGLVRLRASLISLSFAINPMILYITSSTHRHLLLMQFINCNRGKAFTRWYIGKRSSTTTSTRDSSTKRGKKVHYDVLELQAVQTVTTSKRSDRSLEVPRMINAL